MRILVTNDDSLYAEGIRVLEQIARELSDDIWVVAPKEEQSGAGHSLSLHNPLRLKQVDDRHFAVEGTPTDSVLMALLEVMPERPDLVLSGINKGLNVAEDVTYSGTIAAAMEGTLLDVPSIALSMQWKQGEDMPWQTARHFAPDLIKQLYDMRWPKGNLINVNFPHLPVEEVAGIKVCPQGRRKIGEKLEKRQDPKGLDYFWIGGPCDEPYDDLPGADYMQVHKGFITVTPLSMDLTNYQEMEKIREHLDG